MFDFEEPVMSVMEGLGNSGFMEATLQPDMEFSRKRKLKMTKAAKRARAYRRRHGRR